MLQTYRHDNTRKLIRAAWRYPVDRSDVSDG
jgi:hypothetical protein